jgi:hypothetical protein
MMMEAEAASMSEILVDTYWFVWCPFLEHHYLWLCPWCQVVGCNYTDIDYLLYLNINIGIAPNLNSLTTREESAPKLLHIINITCMTGSVKHNIDDSYVIKMYPFPHLNVYCYLEVLFKPSMTVACKCDSV